MSCLSGNDRAVFGPAAREADSKSAALARDPSDTSIMSIGYTRRLRSAPAVAHRRSDMSAGQVHRGLLTCGALTAVRSYDVGRCVGVAVPVAEAGGGWAVAARDGFAHLAEDGTVTP